MINGFITVIRRCYVIKQMYYTVIWVSFLCGWINEISKKVKYLCSVLMTFRFIVD
jgi:hypothetical protein